MIKTVFTILLCVHLLGDFYFQTQKMADRKRERFSWTIGHSLIYALCSWLLFFLFLPGMKIKYILTFVLAHALIDIVKYGVCRQWGRRCPPLKSVLSGRNVFLFDQAAHLLTILGIAFWKRTIDAAGLHREGIQAFFDAFGFHEAVLIRCAVVLLLIHKPANILIANILSGYKPDGKNAPDGGKTVQGDRNAGRMIGTLERIIMVIFIAIGQYSAVGLVLTAKSIARYDRISKDQSFAEYYLLGTLLSTICAAAVTLLFF